MSAEPQATTPSSPGPPAAAPGAVFPLRPMAQEETFSAAFAVIRRNPRAALGVPFLAGLLNFLVSLVLLVVLPSETYTRMLVDPMAYENPELTWAAMSDGWVMLLMTLTSFLGILIMALPLGLLGIPALRAAYGLPSSLRQTLTLRAGTIGWLLLHLLLLTVLLSVLALVAVVLGGVLLGVTLFTAVIVVVPGLFLLLCWVTAAVMFGPLVIVVERRNAFSAVARSFSLNRGLWWRHIGAAALMYLMLGIALLVASLPAGLIAGFGGGLAWQSPSGQEDGLVLLVLGLVQLYDTVLSALLIALVGTVIAVTYLNARFRQEALDVVLLHAATAPSQSPTDLDQLLPGSPEHVRGYLTGHLGPGAGPR